MPLFYSRGQDDLPRDWIALMRTAMADLCPVFNTNRMVCEYTLQGYSPALLRVQRLEADGCRRGRELARWREKVRQSWKGVRIARIESKLPAETRVGARFEVKVWIQAPGLSPSDLKVEVYLGRLDENKEILDGAAYPMRADEAASADGFLFSAEVPCVRSGTLGFTIRVVPQHADLHRAHDTGLIAWAG